MSSTLRIAICPRLDSGKLPKSLLLAGISEVIYCLCNFRSLQSLHKIIDGGINILPNSYVNFVNCDIFYIRTRRLVDHDCKTRLQLTLVW